MLHTPEDYVKLIDGTLKEQGSPLTHLQLLAIRAALQNMAVEYADARAQARKRIKIALASMTIDGLGKDSVFDAGAAFALGQCIGQARQIVERDGEPV